MATTCKEEKGDQVQNHQQEKKSYKAFLWSFFVSMTGGLILGWWEHEYHPNYEQLWMVPIGLILFVTPAFICFAVFISESCNSKDYYQVSSRDSIYVADQKQVKQVPTV